MTRTVSAREANQQFSRLLGEVARGEEIVITRRGQPVVASLAPYRGPPVTPGRRAALERLMALGRKGFHLGGVRATRDEMHER